MISNSSLLEKKKIASERKLITAEKTIAALQAIINESQNNLIFLLEKLQLRESDIDEEISVYF